MQVRLLEVALVASAAVEAVYALATTQADKLKYASFSRIMDSCGGQQWKAVPVTTAAGYNLTLFNIHSDATQVAYSGTKGPILLLEGLYSDAKDWISCAQSGHPSIAVQLAQ